MGYQVINKYAQNTLLQNVMQNISQVNFILKENFSSIEIIFLTIAIFFIVNKIFSGIRSIFSLSFEEIKCKIFRMALFIPLVKGEVEKEVEKMVTDCTKKYSDARKGKLTPVLPNYGVARDHILKKVEGFTAAGK